MGATVVAPQRQHQSQRASVGSQSLVAREDDGAAGEAVEHAAMGEGSAIDKLDGQQHLYHVLPRGKEIVGFVEDTVTKTSSHDDTHKAIEEEWVKILVLDALVVVEPSHEEVGEGQSGKPAQSVPAHIKRPEMQRCRIGVPEDKVEQTCHSLMRYTLNRKCMMSPSWTTYSLPSMPSLPASRTAASEPYWM